MLVKAALFLTVGAVATLDGRARTLALIIAALLGLSLAPFFPSTFALLIRNNPSAREAGFILAVSGLGAAGRQRGGNPQMHDPGAQTVSAPPWHRLL